MTPEQAQRVSLLGVEPELARRIPDADLPLARRHLTARLVELPSGPVSLDLPGPDARRPFGAIVLEGLLLREVTVMDQPAAQLIGPGDIIALDHPAALLLPRTVSLTCTGPCRLGVLDDPLLLTFRRWPGVGAAFVERAGEQLDRLALQHAIGQLPRVHDRILATLWHLSERYGRVTPSGVHLPVTLTHRLLGRLVGARRPTVSLALNELEEEGAIGRRTDRTWLILRTPPEIKEQDVTGPVASPRVRTPDLVEEPAPIAIARTVAEPGWTEEMRRELAESVNRLQAAHAESARRFADGLGRYQAVRSRARGVRERAEATRTRVSVPRGQDP